MSQGKKCIKNSVPIIRFSSFSNSPCNLDSNSPCDLDSHAKVITIIDLCWAELPILLFLCPFSCTVANNQIILKGDVYFAKTYETTSIRHTFSADNYFFKKCGQPPSPKK